MPEFIKVASTDDVPVGAIKLFSVGGSEVIVARTGGRFFAASTVCTHAGGPLAKGRLNGDTLICPWHGSVFDLKTGRVLSGPAADDLKIYKVKIEHYEIFVGI